MPGLCWNFWIVKSFSVGISWLTDAFRYRIINLKNIYTHVFFFLAFLAEVQSCLREFCPACRWHFSDSGFLSLWVRVKWYKCLESVRRILLRRSIDLSTCFFYALRYALFWLARGCFRLLGLYRVWVYKYFSRMCLVSDFLVFLTFTARAVSGPSRVPQHRILEVRLTFVRLFEMRPVLGYNDRA